MTTLASTASQLLVDRFINSDLSAMSRTKAGLGIFAFSGFMAMVAAGFFLYAAHLWSNAHFAPDAAALITGFSALALAFVGLFTAYLLHRIKMSKVKQLKDDVVDQVQEYIELFEDEFSEPIRENPKTAAAVSSIAGYMVGNKLL